MISTAVRFQFTLNARLPAGKARIHLDRFNRDFWAEHSREGMNQPDSQMPRLRYFEALIANGTLATCT
jgi:hypothetical protein